MSDRIPMTREGYDRIKAEIDRLNTVELPKILERLATARAEGDLSENAEYQGLQEQRRLMEAKINALRDKLSRAVLLDPAKMPKDEVAFGCTVRVKDLEFGDEEEFTLVGAGEEDYDAGKILFTSPLAQGLRARSGLKSWKSGTSSAGRVVPGGLSRGSCAACRHGSRLLPLSRVLGGRTTAKLLGRLGFDGALVLRAPLDRRWKNLPLSRLAAGLAPFSAAWSPASRARKRPVAPARSGHAQFAADRTAGPQKCVHHDCR